MYFWCTLDSAELVAGRVHNIVNVAEGLQKTEILITFSI
jgi:hypothetical protein